MTGADNFIHDFGNFKMMLDSTDNDVSKQIKESGWYQDEKFETSVFQKLLKKGMTIIDLGANIGFYTMLARSIIGESGRVISFEPFPKNIKLIKNNLMLNSYENIHVVESAVGNKNGKTFLHISQDANSENSLLDLNSNFNLGWKDTQKIEINVITLDDYLEKIERNIHVDFIKMDIEGSESKALDGMQNTLQKNDDLIIMTEFWPNGLIKNNSNPEEFLGKLNEMGFRIYHLDAIQEKTHSISVDEIKKIMDESNKHPKDEFMKIWGWYTNLLCIKGSKFSID